MAKPFLKWPGGKRSLLSEISARAPVEFGAYHEPFLGGGAVYFEMVASGRANPRDSFLNDANRRLMRAYEGVQNHPHGVIQKLRRMPNTEAFFLKQRRRDPDAMNSDAAAAWLIYLSKTCFNGLYRVNKKGEFNAPYGRYEKPKLFDFDNIIGCYKALYGTHLDNIDFQAAMARAKPGEFVFCDPPYAPRTGKDFVSYTSDGFGWADHIRLRDAALKLKRAGVHVMITNSGTDDVRELYSDPAFDVAEVGARRSIGASGTTRGHVLDFIIT